MVLEKVEQAADVVVGVLQEPGKDLHHAGVELLLLGRERVPLGHVGVVAGEFGVRRDDAQLFLAGKGLLAIGLPAIVELALVLVGPFLAHVMRRVHGPGAEVHEEGLVGRHLFGVGDEADGLVHQVLGDVIALLRRLGRLHLVVVVDQFRVVLVGLAAEKAVVALKAAAQRPAVVGAGRRDLVGRGQVPLADGVGVVAVLQQDLRQKAVLEGDVAVGAGIAGRGLR